MTGSVRALWTGACGAGDADGLIGTGLALLLALGGYFAPRLRRTFGA